MRTNKLKIAFLLPGNGLSGGVFVVYIQAQALAKRGHDVTVIFWNFDKSKKFDYFRDFNLNFLQLDEISPDAHFDIAIATWWETFFMLPKLPASKHFYFVQSDERRFYSVENTIMRGWVETTYSFKEIGIITEARWIKSALESEFGLNVAYAPNGIKNTLFHPGVAPIAAKSSKFRVLIEGPGKVPFKRIADAFAITNTFSDIEVWYISSDNHAEPDWRYDRFFSAVPFDEMPSIYRACDILIKISSVEGFFGPPLEMMACGGTCIVSNVTGFDEYIVDSFNALVIDVGDVEAGKRALKRLKEDRRFRDELASNGHITALGLDWEMQYPKFEAALFELLEQMPDTPTRTLNMISKLWDCRVQLETQVLSSLSPHRYYASFLKQQFRLRFPRVFRFAKANLGRIRAFRTASKEKRDLKTFKKKASESRRNASPFEIRSQSLSKTSQLSRLGKIMFVGQAEYFRSVYADAVFSGEHHHFEMNLGNLDALLNLPAEVARLKCESVIIFRPEWLKDYPSVLAKLKENKITLIGYSSEPVPLDRTGGSHPDQLLRLTSVSQAKALPYDLIIHFDEASEKTMREIGFKNIFFWPLPVSSSIFFPENSEPDFDICFIGRSTPHREKLLGVLKTKFTLVHIAHGLHDENARSLMNRSKLVLNLHNHDYLNFENRVAQAILCGRTVVSEALSNSILIKNEDYVCFSGAAELIYKVQNLIDSGNWQQKHKNPKSENFAIYRMLEETARYLYASADCAPAPRLSHEE